MRAVRLLYALAVINLVILVGDLAFNVLAGLVPMVK
jgi:hypothetical protein